MLRGRFGSRGQSELVAPTLKRLHDWNAVSQMEESSSFHQFNVILPMHSQFSGSNTASVTWQRYIQERFTHKALVDGVLTGP